MLGACVAGRFQIEERLGAGGMGVVYRAHQSHVDRPVAIKVLHPERAGDEAASEQFLREARAVSQLSSPHTVTLIDVGPLESGGWFLAMELLEGHTLRTKLSQGAIALEEAVRIAGQIALSLGEAHARGIVHRDLKPLNVFLARTPGHAVSVKVLDFGLATLAHAEPSDEESSGGTPRYMAPEAITGSSASPRGDIYALGLILYEMLTGRHPFEGLEGDALLDAQLGEPPPPLSEQDAPEALRKLVERCLAKHPRLRPRDGGAFRDALREAVGLPDDKPEPELGDPAAEPVRGHDTKSTLPSTMSLARLRARLRPEKRSRTVWLIPAAAIVAGGVWLQRSSQADTPPPAATPAAPTATPSPEPPRSAAPPSVASSAASPPESVVILFHSIPDGAEVRIGGEARGKTPINIPLEKGVPVAAELDLPGYPAAEIEVTPTESTTVRHVFRRVRAAPTADPVERKVDHYLD
jgi:serine/threonine-protein kinase